MEASSASILNPVRRAQGLDWRSGSRLAATALLVSLVLGFINATIGFVLKIITFPLTILTLGLFWLVINALMLELASALLSPGFQVRNFLAAFIGSIVLSLVNLLLKGIVMPSKDSH